MVERATVKFEGSVGTTTSDVAALEGMGQKSPKLWDMKIFFFFPSAQIYHDLVRRI